MELVKRLYDTWEKDGFGVVPALMDPDIEYVNPPYAVEPGTRRGYRGFATAAEAIHTVYQPVGSSRSRSTTHRTGWR